MSAASPSSPPSPTLLRSILLLSAAAFASSASMRICDPMLPRLADTFGAPLAAVSAVVTLFAIAYGVLQIVWGPVGDRLGKYRLATLATSAAALASLACAMAPSLAALTAARFAAGAIAAAIIPLSIAWIGDVVPFEHRQPVLARFMSGSILGVVSGQLIGGLLVDSLGWRWAFVALASVFVVAGALLWRELPNVPRAAPVSAPFSPRAMAGHYAAVLRDPWVRRMLALVLAEGLLVFGSLAFIPTTLHERHGLALWAAGLIASGFAFGGLAYTGLARRLIPLLGEQGLALGGGLLLALGMLTVDVSPWWPGALAGCLMMGVGFYGMHNTMQTHGTQMAPTQRGLGVALFAFCFFVGQSAGVAIASALIQAFGFATVYAVYAAGVAVLAWRFRAALRWRAARRG